MQLNGLDALDAFDFSSLFSTIGNAVAKSGPELIKAAADKQMAKLKLQQAEAQRKAMEAMVVPVAAPTVTTVTLPNTPVPRQTVPASSGIDKKYFFIGGGLLLGGVLLFAVTR